MHRQTLDEWERDREMTSEKKEREREEELADKQNERQHKCHIIKILCWENFAQEFG